MDFTLAKLRAQALKALGFDPFDSAALRRVLGTTNDYSLSYLRRMVLQANNVDPFNRDALKNTISRHGGRMPAPHVPKVKKPRAPRAKGAARTPRSAKVPPAPKVPKVPKLFADFIASGCKNLRQAATLLGISPQPPIMRATLRAAWIALIAKHHPDRGGNSESAQAINAAYQLLRRFQS